MPDTPTTTDPQAAMLARWLQQEPGAEPPAALDPELVEAVYALRPDRAPPARVELDEILAAVREGPYAAAAPEAVQGLVAWLEAHPGAEPPAAVEPEVVEAVYALRPDLAPAPRVELDDILGAVQAGPYAAAPDNVVSFPAAARDAAAPVAPTASHARPRRGPPEDPARAPAGRRRLPWWAVPGMGGLAVAATALLVVAPLTRQAMEAPSPYAASELRQDAAAPAAAPAAPTEEATADALPTAADEADGAEAPAAAAPEGQAQAGLDTGGPRPATAPLGGAPAPARSAPAGPATGAVATSTATTGAVAANEAAKPTAPARSAPPADAYADLPGGAARSDAPAVPTERSSAASGAAAQAPRVEVAAAEPPAPAEEAEEAEEAEATLSESTPVGTAASGRAVTRARDATSAEAKAQRREQGLDLARKKEASAPRAPAAAPQADADALDDQAPASAGEAVADLEVAAPPPTIDTLRSQAWSVAGTPDPTAADPALAAAWQAAAAAEARGDDAGVQAALRPLLAHADAQVAQGAAARLAAWQLSLGRARDALATVELGLRRGRSGALAARLYALQGQAWERLGAPESAARSYQDAVDAR